MTWICFSCFSTVDCFLNFELSRVFFVFSLFSAVCGYIWFLPCFWIFCWQLSLMGSFTIELVELVAAKKESSSIIVLVGTDPTGAIVNSSACLDYKTRLAEVNMAKVDAATQILPLVYHGPP